MRSGVVAISCLLGCGAVGTSNDFGALPDSGGSSGGNIVGEGGAGDGGKPAEKTLLYAHTDTVLYQLDPTDTKQQTKLGEFDCVGPSKGDAKAMTDIAVSKTGKLYGISQVAAYPLTQNGMTIACDATWNLPTAAPFYGLTMAPEGVLGTGEVLVGANQAGDLFTIDSGTGQTNKVGSFGKDASGDAYELSGDIVFLANGGNPVGFATVRSCPKGNCNQTDTLIELDVRAIKPGAGSILQSVRGQAKRGSWCTNKSSPATFGSIFGIAAFQDKVFGFTRDGEVVEMHNNDGSACLVAVRTGEKFAGAGVTTSAPVVVPN